MQQAMSQSYDPMQYYQFTGSYDPSGTYHTFLPTTLASSPNSQPFPMISPPITTTHARVAHPSQSNQPLSTSSFTPDAKPLPPPPLKPARLSDFDPERVRVYNNIKDNLATRRPLKQKDIKMKVSEYVCLLLADEYAQAPRQLSPSYEVAPPANPPRGKRNRRTRRMWIKMDRQTALEHIDSTGR